MSLENYFRRGATGFLATQQTKLKDIKAAMDLVFGFFESEIRDWIDAVLKSDTVYVSFTSWTWETLMLMWL